MSGKLDQSLGEVISAQRRSAGRRRSQRAGAGPKAAAPVGGIQKTAKAKNARGAAGKAAPARAATPHGESKVIVSNLVCITQSTVFARMLTFHSPRMSRSSRSRYVSVEATSCPSDFVRLWFFLEELPSTDARTRSQMARC